MSSHRLTLLADYHQFYLQDESARGGLAEAWTPVAVERMLAVGDGVVGFGTARNMLVPVTLQFLEVGPSLDLAGADHVVEGSLTIHSGRVVVAGCTDHFPDAARYDLPPGTYRVRMSIIGIDTLSDDGLDGEDHYLVQLWPATAIEPIVLKQGTV